MTKAQRPNLYLITALRRKYAQGLGMVRHGATAELAADLGALARVIHLFKPGDDLAAIKSIRPYRPQRSKYLKDALGVLRLADEPMTAREVARRVLTARGVPLVRSNLQRVECSLHAVFERLEGQGLERVGDEPKRWRIEG
jgi:hypothetical protein